MGHSVESFTKIKDCYTCLYFIVNSMKISSVVIMSWDTHEWPEQKPCCRLVSSLKLSK